MTNLTLQLTFTTETCCNCGVPFAMESNYQKFKLKDKTTFYCPNGHGQSYTGKTDEQLRKEAEKRADRLQAALTHEHDQREAAERSAASYKGQVTKIKRRVGKGVCPCCNRYFRELGDHMTTEHPDYAESGPTE